MIILYIFLILAAVVFYVWWIIWVYPYHKVQAAVDEVDAAMAWKPPRPLPAQPTSRIWRNGKPPHAGWWNASTHRDPEAWRWYDGKQWGETARPWYSAVAAKSQALGSAPTWAAKRMEWTDYWPEGARVPRIDPNGGQHG